MDLLDTQVYVLIGDEGFTRLCAAFFQKVPTDDILGPMYRHDLAGAEHRLRSFLAGRFGGPDSYVRERGHPRLRMRHAAFAIDQPARDRWVARMDEALDEAKFDSAAERMLRQFFHDSATFLINRGA